jgi:uncharacterized NAD(P)/FAD-binding protein YdhS/predicted metal-dependent enzyme (double-stranded beta helix superfamily)
MEIDSPIEAVQSGRAKASIGAMANSTGALAALIRQLDDVAAGWTPLDLVRAVESAQVTPDEVAPFVRRGLQSYYRMPVVVREHYEMLVLTWSAGQGSPPHEHSGSVCVVRIVQGTATEAYYSIASDGFVDLEYEETVATDRVTSLHDAGVHSIRNASPAGETLVTLHVYSPPLRAGRRFVSRRTPVQGRPSPDDSIPTVAVIGGGFSGSITAANLLRRAASPLRVILVERQGSIGEGVAYATREPAHRLNVPAESMSAWPERSGDFLDWMRRRNPEVQTGDFPARQLYGDYVRDTVSDTAQRSCGALDIVFDEARRVSQTPAGHWMVHLARGSSFRAAAVVLALGHSPPSDPIGPKWAGPRSRFVRDPWRPFAMNAIQEDEPVLILGTGLTAVDTVLSLTEHSRSAKISLVSLNGLAPQSHANTPLSPVDLSRWIEEQLKGGRPVSALALSRGIRALVRRLRKDGVDWRQAVDGLRPHTAALWKALPLRERRAFLSRLRPFWEVHRHRMPPAIASRLSGLIGERKVEIIAGRIESASESGDQVAVRVRSRGGGLEEELRVGWVVNCTGPLPSNRPESNPAIASLMARRQITPDALALGIETSSRGNAVAANGEELADVFVVGTLRKPACWESTAVPELREQAAQVAVEILSSLTALHA